MKDNQTKGYSQQLLDAAYREIVLEGFSSKPSDQDEREAAELKKVEVKDADVEAIVAALEVEKDTALDALRREKGDLKDALSRLIAPPATLTAAAG
jgi:NACalpha-BTF3-like transcription factor